MLKHYLYIALRSLRRYKAYTFINIAGLAIGLACCILIFLFVREERQYDRFHENADRIYRVVNERHADGSVSHRASTPPTFGPTMASEFPEVVHAVRFFVLGKTLVHRGEATFFERNVYVADSTLFDVFSFPLVQGDAATALVAPYSVVLSRRMARKYFGDENPVGQTLTFSGESALTVTGVLADIPVQSHLVLDFVLSFSTMPSMTSEERLASWRWQQFYTYLLLPPGYDPAHLEAKFPDFIARYATPETSANGFSYVTHLQPLTAIHLHSSHLEFDWVQSGRQGDVTYVYAFSFTALFVLLIACFNFMNLATARSMQRAKEVGMRKVVGARRGQLLGQFLGESTLMALLALILALGLVHLMLPGFNTFTEKSITLRYDQDLSLVLSLLGVTLGVGLLAGSYPAFLLSAFRPLSVLKGQMGGEGYSLTSLRKGLVVIQFALSMLLLIGTSVVYRQIDFVKNKKLGFDKEQVVVLPLRGDMDDNLETLKGELLRNPQVVSAAGSWGIPGGVVAGDDIRLPNSEASWPTNMFTVDHDYLQTFEMALVAGRDFSRAFPADADQAFILNETAARDLGWSAEEALGKEIWWDEWEEDALKKGRVVGVVQDFHFRSLHQAVEPLVMHIYPAAFGHVSVRIRPDEVAATLAFLEETWRSWAPAWPFEYYFLDDDLDEMYRAEERIGTLAAAFALLAILVACLGLFGLAAYSAERRTKEIGVRKVLGASVGRIVLLLSREFSVLVGVAFVVAAPLAYLAMDRWLGTFVYRVDIGLGAFVLVGLAVLVLAWLTVGYQSIKAARLDPVETLRYE